MFTRISRRLGWGIIGALMVALLGALAGVIYAGPADPPSNLSAGTSTQQGLIFQPANCAGFPITIGSPGSYKLAQDIIIPSGCGTGAINIAVADVTLDLDGHQVGGTAGNSVGINVAAATGVVIKNGRVVNFPGDGMFMSASDGVVQDMVLRGNGGSGLNVSGARVHVMRVTSKGNGLDGFRIGADSVISDCLATNNTQRGINLTASHGFVSGCEASANGFQGIWSSGGGNNLVVHNNVHDNTSDGVAVSGGSNRVNDNDVNFNGGIGIWAAGDTNQVSNNNVGHSGAQGIKVEGTGCGVALPPCATANAGEVSGNVSSHNGLEGILITGDDGTIARNTASDNAGIGISVTGRGNRVDENHVASNGGVGLAVAAAGHANLVTRNTSDFNIGTAFSIDPSNQQGPNGTLNLATNPWANVHD